ncbi:MAG: hypothetical protein VX589_07430, partial [Myxococcota bacterium]|nr:hypothetical protein [Myxococcota bacterium]
FERGTIEFDLSIEVGTANINVTPSIVSFPPGTAGAMPVTEIVAVSNNGSEPLIVQSIQFQRITPAPMIEGVTTEFELDGNRGQLPPFTINPGDNPVEVFIKYSPKDDGIDEANAIFRSNAVGFESGFPVLLTSGEVASKLVVQPNPVRFETTSGATTLTKQITLTNAGTRTLDILNIFVQSAECQADGECAPFRCQPPVRSDSPQRCGSAYSLATGSDTSYQLRPGTSKTVNVNYTPKSASGSDGLLRIETQKADNVESGFLEIPLLKPGTEVKIILVDPPTVEMNNIMAPGMGAQTFKVQNVGTLPLSINAIALTEQSDAMMPTDSKVTLTQGAVSGSPLTLMPGESHDVEVTITRGPMDTQTLISGFVKIESDATGSDEIFVSITSNPPVR